MTYLPFHMLTSTYLNIGILSASLDSPDKWTTIGIAVTTLGTIAVSVVAIIPKLIESKKSKGEGRSGYEATVSPGPEAYPIDSEIKLEYHSIFSRMDMHLNHINISFTMPENYGKQLLVAEALRNKIIIWKEILLNMAKEIDACVLTCDHSDCNKIENIMMHHYNDGMEKYMTFYKDDVRYTKDEQTCLALFMQKFSRWHSPRAAAVETGISRTCGNKYYTGCRIKGAICLDIYQGAFAETMNDIEDTMKDINGDLKGLVFKNHTIEKDGVN